MNPNADKIAALLATVQLGHGMGTPDRPCSIAAINLAIDGRLTDDIPDCMSAVIGEWIKPIQDAMPLDRLNGPRWRALLPLAAGTGRAHEAERLEIIMDWMWDTVLPQLQPLADERGFGAEWRRMTDDRTEDAADAAAKAAWVAIRGVEATWAAEAAMAAAEAAMAAEWVRAAEWAMWAAHWLQPGTPAFWDAIDPEGLLDRLIAVGDMRPRCHSLAVRSGGV